MRATRRTGYGGLLPIAAVLLGAAGCGGPAGPGGIGAQTSGDAAGRLGGVDSYMVTYGPLDEGAMALAKSYPLVILHPTGADLTRARVAEIQAGLDSSDASDDVLVLCYVSVGEDMRTAGRSDDELRADPRFAGDGSGPRVDPRGPLDEGGPLDGIDPRGRPSPGGTAFASYYLDDNSLLRDGRGDGIPDRNSRFGAYFVNAGDPRWFDVVDAMTRDGPDGITGLREALTTGYGRGLGCDGVFLDTLDTAAPNSFTDLWSDNVSKFEWTAPGFSSFVRRVREHYPKAVILQNRGLFFLDPRHPHYKFTTRGSIDVVLFESFRLNSNTYEEWDPVHYAENRYDLAPIVMAEANRPDGFRVLSLGYAEGPAGAMSHDTLLGASDVGMASLLEDIRVTQEVAGFRHYITDGEVKLVNSFVRDRATLDDATPPVWTSTYNDRRALPAEEPTPRVGIQQAIPGSRPGEVLVRWDVALDKHRVRYVLYHQPTPFDFSAAAPLASATRVQLTPEVGDGYAEGVAPDRFPYQARVTGLEPGRLHHLLIRAVDDSAAANEDKNEVVVTAIAR